MLMHEIIRDESKLCEATGLFNACFRIQREASEAAGRHIPMIVENVVGAQKWVGRAAWHYGSYYLWGDVPALMPQAGGMKNSGGSWFGQRDGQALERNDPRDLRRNENGDWENAAAVGGWNHPGKQFDGYDIHAEALDENRDLSGSTVMADIIVNGKRVRIIREDDSRKNEGGSWFNVAPHNKERGRNPVNVNTAAQRYREGVKQSGTPNEAWSDNGIAKASSRSDSRKAASALIAEIPFELARYIASCWKLDASEKTEAVGQLARR